MIVVRTAGPALSMVEPIRDAIGELGTDVAVVAITSMQQKAAESYAMPRFYARMIGIFAGFAVLLAAGGIYGTVAFSVGQRTREIGLRMALGARPEQVKKMIVGRALRSVLLGVALGTAGSFAVIPVLAGFLYGMDPVDPVTFASVAMLLTAVVIVASYVPARRATQVDPLAALRYE